MSETDLQILQEPEENYLTGWIKIFRSIKNHWIWQDPVKFQWWVDILLTVNHSGKKINIGFDLIECKPGQTIKSLFTWAKEWNVSKDTVRNFFTLLKKDKMILTENLKKTTRLTVCNYDTYQSALHDKQTTSKRKANDKQTQSDPNKNDKNDKNEKTIYGSQKNISLTQIEYDRLKIEFNGYCDKAIEFLSLYKIEKNYKTKSDNLTIRRWVINAVKEQETKQPIQIQRPEFKKLTPA